jgi:hypothetical protein
VFPKVSKLASHERRGDGGDGDEHPTGHPPGPRTGARRGRAHQRKVLAILGRIRGVAVHKLDLKKQKAFETLQVQGLGHQALASTFQVQGLETRRFRALCRCQG